MALTISWNSALRGLRRQRVVDHAQVGEGDAGHRHLILEDVVDPGPDVRKGQVQSLEKIDHGVNDEGENYLGAAGAASISFSFERQN